MYNRRKAVFALIPITLLFSSSVQAASRSSWDGTWSGAWGGSRATSVTVASNKVVSYTFEGASTPVVHSTVSAKRIVYGDNGTVVTLTRTSAKKAHATLHSSQGNATANLTKQ